MDQETEQIDKRYFNMQKIDQKVPFCKIHSLLNSELHPIISFFRSYQKHNSRSLRMIEFTFRLSLILLISLVAQFAYVNVETLNPEMLLDGGFRFLQDTAASNRTD